MNTQKIKFTTKGTAKEIEVQGCYPYLEVPTQDKVVLIITTTDDDATAQELESIRDNDGTIELYEREIVEEVAGDWELKETYTDYNSGDIRTSYQNHIREARVTRVEGLVKDQAQLRADVDFIAIMADIPLE